MFENDAVVFAWQEIMQPPILPLASGFALIIPPAQ